jgi:hypothetical protein
MSKSAFFWKIKTFGMVVESEGFFGVLIVDLDLAKEGNVEFGEGLEDGDEVKAKPALRGLPAGLRGNTR